MKTAFVFPGQGAQYFGMGKDFYETYQTSKEIYRCASDILHLDMAKLCFEENDKLDITEYTQAALFTTCAAMYEAVKELGVSADVAAGLSLGEYSALYACGAYDFEDAVKCVRQRGIYMQQEVPIGRGAMSAVVGLDTNVIEDVCSQVDGIVAIANYNCPGQIVISGETDAVRAAGEKMSELGALKVIPLNVSGPFHSSMLKGAGVKLKGVLETIKWNNLEIPYVANVNAEYISDIEKVQELLVEQVSSPVRWQQSVEEMINNGADCFVEIGPGNTLRKFIKKISKKVTVINVGTIGDLVQLEKR